MIDRSRCYRLDRKPVMCLILLRRRSYWRIEWHVKRLPRFWLWTSDKPTTFQKYPECMLPHGIWNSNWRAEMARKKTAYNFNLDTRCEQVPGSRSLLRLNLVPWRLVFEGPRYGTCFVSPFWRPEFWNGCKDLENVCSAALDRPCLRMF
jgi:hypothetical protein